MKDYKDNALKERLGNAARGKAALRERVKALPGASDPGVIERKAAREEIAEARQRRVEARKQDEKDRLAKAEEERTERDAQDARQVKLTADLEVARMSEQKAQRDARYAARKKRKA